jgi:hypothetical protein
MPFRKLPNTDSSRLDALRVAIAKAESTPADQLISRENYNLLHTFYPKFKKEIEERGIALSDQSGATIARLAAESKCRMYASHFFQVFNLGIAREKYRVEERAFFGLNVSQETIPSLVSEENLRNYTESIISGDVTRVAAGGAEMSNPSKAEVELAYNDFTAKVNLQSNKKDLYDKEQKDVDDLRAEADELIRDIWDEIEFKCRKDEPAAMRRKAREYGVVYVTRPGEPPEDIAPAEPAADTK